MKYLNEKGDDVSAELMIPFAIMLECTWAAEIIAYRMSDTMDAYFQTHTLVQKKKQEFRKARQMVESVIRHLEYSFDVDFNRAGEKGAGYTDVIQENANDILKLLLIYFSRSDTDWEKKHRMKQALINFKPSEEVKDIDLVGLLKYFKLQ